MNHWKIKLENTNNVALFVSICGQYKFDIDVKSGRYTLDGKSLMGMLSFSPDRVMEVEIHTDNKELIEKFHKEIKLWIVEE